MNKLIVNQSKEVTNLIDSYINKIQDEVENAEINSTQKTFSVALGLDLWQFQEEIETALKYFLDTQYGKNSYLFDHLPSGFRIRFKVHRFLEQIGLVYIETLDKKWKPLYLDTCTASDFINKTFLKKLSRVDSTRLIRIDNYTYHFQNKLGGINRIFFVPINGEEK